MTANRPKPTPKTRRIYSFEPCGPVSAMVAAELKRKFNGRSRKLREVLEECVVAALSLKYPKLAERFRARGEEGAR